MSWVVYSAICLVELKEMTRGDGMVDEMVAQLDLTSVGRLGGLRAEDLAAQMVLTTAAVMADR